MSQAKGEMPFLDHLEELRSRILWSVVALIVGVGAGIWLVSTFPLIKIITAPIQDYLVPGPDGSPGKLVNLGISDGVMFQLKLALIIGLVIASPIIIWQLWAFLSPALYAKEKRAIVPALFAGVGLFITGSVLSFRYLLPQALSIMNKFAEDFTTLYTADRYMSFVLQIVLSMGLASELPLVIIVLAALGVVTPRMLSKFRRIALVLACVGGAILSPGTDLLSMLMMTVPLYGLYELGYLGAVIIAFFKRKASSTVPAAIIVLALLPWSGKAQGRDTVRVGRDTVRTDTLPTDSLAQGIDTSEAERYGLPKAPKMSFPEPDSVMEALRASLRDYDFMRYRADSALVDARAKRVRLSGNAMGEYDKGILEASEIVYSAEECFLFARGSPHFFKDNTVVAGDSVNVNSCTNRSIARRGQTSFPQQGANWIITGNLAIDSAGRRVYAAAEGITSCSLADPHYRFKAGEVKWVSDGVMVARPAVLYIRDVPIAWLPFLFQDTKRGRRSGILIPEFGINDIVRPNRGYNRTIRNIGYYFALSDNLGLLTKIDWYANRYTAFNVAGQYNFRDHFVRGAIDYSRQTQTDGNRNSQIVWNHWQSFGQQTTLQASVNYQTSTAFIRRNSIDPRMSTQNIRSSALLSRHFSWGNLNIGATRSQSVNDGSGTMDLPNLSFVPSPISIGQSVSWNPTLSVVNTLAFKQPLPDIIFPDTAGPADTARQTGSSRSSRISFQTPVTVGRFTLPMDIQVADADSTGAREELITVPDESTPDPYDSITVREISAGGFGSSVDWNTSINLPLLFSRSWKLTPSIGMTNTTGGPFAIRNRRTNGRFVQQGKRFQFGASISPTFYGFFGGIGPFTRFRHSIQPSLRYTFSPAADVPLEYAEAIAVRGQAPELRSLQTQRLTLSLNQTIEGKRRVKGSAGGDASTGGSKFRLLSLSTGFPSYDIEKAKQPGKRGWAGGTLTNTILSDLIPGLSLSLTHDLFLGAFDSDTAKFRPFLTAINSSFTLTGNTVRSVGRLFGFGGPSSPDGTVTTTNPQPYNPYGQYPDLERGTGFMNNRGYSPMGRGFSANVNISVVRSRPQANPFLNAFGNRSNVSLSTSFSPTRFWQVSWTTQYDATNKRFEGQALDLTRDLHDWRARFSFTKSPNGNFSFSLNISLIDLPSLNFPYRQTSIGAETQ